MHYSRHRLTASATARIRTRTRQPMTSGLARWSVRQELNRVGSVQLRRCVYAPLFYIRVVYIQRTSQRNPGPSRGSAVVRVLYVVGPHHVANVPALRLRPYRHVSVSSQRAGRRQCRQVLRTRHSLLFFVDLKRANKPCDNNYINNDD